MHLRRHQGIGNYKIKFSLGHRINKIVAIDGGMDLNSRVKRKLLSVLCYFKVKYSLPRYAFENFVMTTGARTGAQL
ncbi:hypothetical protein DSUL_200008 [Desulfovibrionales bacterium]